MAVSVAEAAEAAEAAARAARAAACTARDTEFSLELAAQEAARQAQADQFRKAQEAADAREARRLEEEEDRLVRSVFGSSTDSDYLLAQLSAEEEDRRVRLVRSVFESSTDSDALLAQLSAEGPAAGAGGSGAVGNAFGEVEQDGSSYGVALEPTKVLLGDAVFDKVDCGSTAAAGARLDHSTCGYNSLARGLGLRGDAAILELKGVLAPLANEIASRCARRTTPVDFRAIGAQAENEVFAAQAGRGPHPVWIYRESDGLVLKYFRRGQTAPPLVLGYTGAHYYALVRRP